MEVTKAKVDESVRSLLALDKYKPLSPHLGGAFWAVEAIWAAINAFKTFGHGSLEGLLLTALSVPSSVFLLLKDFVSDLMIVLAIVAVEAADIPADAEAFENTPAGSIMVGLLAPEREAMKRAGKNNGTAAVASMLNPAPKAASFTAAAAKNTGEAGGRIASRVFRGR